MKKLTQITLVTVALMGLAACSSSPQPTAQDEMAARLAQLQAQQEAMEQRQRDAEQSQREKEIANTPDWIERPPSADSQGFYAVGIGQSKRMNHSRRTARLQAEFELATQYRNEINGNERSYEQGNTDGDVVAQTTFLIDRIIDAVPIVGYQVVEQEITAIDGVFFTYVLLKLPYDQFNVALQQQREQEMDSRVQAQFDDLERRLRDRRVERERAADREHERDLERMEARQRVLNHTGAEAGAPNHEVTPEKSSDGISMNIQGLN